jgi:hypothetical protein
MGYRCFNCQTVVTNGRHGYVECIKAQRSLRYRLIGWLLARLGVRV